MTEIIKGVKGFDKNLKCRDFQYEIGKTFGTDKKPVRCTENGFHFCENPLDVFSYYPPCDGNRFAEVKGGGEISTDNSDSKVAVQKITIVGEITLHKLADLAVKFIFSKIKWEEKKGSNTGYKSAATNTGDWSAATNTGNQSAATNTGDRSAATNTGDRSAATNTGYQSAATNTGDRSAAEVTGKDSIACGLGCDNQARASLGSWIVLAERKDNGEIKAVKSAKIDGKKMKADTWYKLINGQFTEV